jgi:glycosyltransferase involved in cell wall biosynthesis
MNLTFSVIIPCYNAERWIEQTLNSVLEQTYPALEIFVIDDGSTDASLMLVQNLQAQSQVPIHILKGDRLGPAGARNLGIAQAVGDWFAFLDADDWWQPDHLQRIYNAVYQTSDVVYIAAAQHYSMNVNRIVSISATPFDTPQNHLDHDTYFQLYQSHQEPRSLVNAYKKLEGLKMNFVVQKILN